MSVLNEDAALCNHSNYEALLPPKIKGADYERKYFQSPVPYDRHLCALQMCNPDPEIEAAILRGEYTTKLRIVQGPPGTGKTHHLVTVEIAKILEKESQMRILCCAPTNIGVSNMYQRLVMWFQCITSRARITHTMRVSCIITRDPKDKIVCATISSRSGPLLNAEKFDIILVDEASMCMEAWMWGLIRKEVKQIVMVGDTQQLPALVSEEASQLLYGRSMMERLVQIEYPVTFLNVQRRMHPEIIRYPNSIAYNDKLSTEYTPSTKSTWNRTRYSKSMVVAQK